MASVIDLQHPVYAAKREDWFLWRTVGEGGRPFVDEYLLKREGESDSDFQIRLDLTYIPSFAKSALKQVQNSIRQRLVGVNRAGGTKVYQEGVRGVNNTGVDRTGSSMNKFIGDAVLWELVLQGRVGVFVDAPKATQGATVADDLEFSPYLYFYKTENIINWSMDPKNPQRFTGLLLKELVEKVDEETGLAEDWVERFRFYRLGESGNVEVSFYNEKGEQFNPETDTPATSPEILDLTEIPFVLFELSDSLLTDIANHQIALLNLASSDMKYTWQGNTVFLAEHYDPNSVDWSQQAVDDDGTGAGTAAGAITDREGRDTRFLGTDVGVRVPKDMAFPKYVSPDPGPLRASIEKQEQIKREITDLLNQQLKVISSSGPDTAQASEHKEEDGLKAIGDELEYGENKIARIWAMYEGQERAAEVKYPENYEYKTDADRREEAKEQAKLLFVTPSPTAQKAIAKRIVDTMLGGFVTNQEIDKMKKEIEASNGVISDPEILIKLIENDTVSPETVATLLGFDPSEAKKAMDARIERTKELADAQGKLDNPAARGAPDLAINPGPDARAEKDGKPQRGNDKSQRTRREER